MKKLLAIGLTIVVMLTACNHESGEEQKEGKAGAMVVLSKAFYKKFKGKISNIHVTMDLTKNDSVLSGSYYYDKVGLPLSFYGRINPDGTFSFKEMNEKYEETGEFKGSFTDNKTIEGTWTNTITKKTLPFKLKESNDGFVAISTQDFHRENCEIANKFKHHPREDASAWDTLCTTIDVSLMTVKAPHENATKLINNRIREIVYGNSYGVKNIHSMDDLLGSVDGVEEDDGYEVTINCSLVTNDNDIFCVDIGQSVYNFGAAHPNSGGVFYNFDIRTGKEIGLNDLLLPGYNDKLNQLGESIFTETYGSEGWNFEPGGFKLNNNFAIRPGGLTFMFGQYEIGPYAAGMPEVFIPYKEIKDLINPKGPLAHWVK